MYVFNNYKTDCERSEAICYLQRWSCDVYVTCIRDGINEAVNYM
jgi:hypothetical protein